MPIPFVAFRPGKMLCPSCSAILPVVADECPRCHFTATVCLEKYPFQAPRLERLIDPEERLQPHDLKLLNRAVNRFERRFPQTRVHLCVTRLPENADSREFGYWLFNISQPESQEEEHHRFFGILLVIDRANRSASATVGYGLDPFIDDGVLKNILTASKEDFQQGEYAQGVARFLKLTEKRLHDEYKEIIQCAAEWQHAQHNPETKNPSGQSPAPTPARIVTQPAFAEN
jgi:uncharacterized membrane protein YgcG